jgi:site-specific recombinase XerD
MPDLFESPPFWKSDPVEAFSAFVKTEAYLRLGRRSFESDGDTENLLPIRDSSAQVYIHMFTRFARWMRREEQDLFSITAAHLQSFLEYKESEGGKPSRALTSSIRVRYLRMLERVFTHLGIEPNPARHASFAVHHTKAAGRDKPKAVLTDAQQAAFMRALPVAAPFAPDDMDNPAWKRRRDRAMLAMMLGAGLKVSEVIGIRTESVGTMDTTGSIPVSITPRSVNGNAKHHETQLRPFAVPEVTAWIVERKARKIPGDLLFPASLQGGLLNKATVYRYVKETLAQAGIDVHRKGGRTLRNSFAVRELEAGGGVELVGQFLGHKKRKSTEKYLLKNPRHRLSGQDE